MFAKNNKESNGNLLVPPSNGDVLNVQVFMCDKDLNRFIQSERIFIKHGRFGFK